MLVFKFGGASVKDAQGVLNLVNIVKKYQAKQLLIVVSAMGKTTNALENLAKAYYNQSADVHNIFDTIKQYHFDIIAQLFKPGHPVYNEANNTFVEIDWMLEDEPQDDFDFIYDQIVSIGELVATRIVNACLNQELVASRWLDARGYIHTDNTYREGQVDMAKSGEAILHDIPALLQKGVLVTQGFIGGTSENFTTTLGREGSDYTAAIFAACLGADSVTTWKDVPGILNADPKLFSDTVKLDELTYNEAIEITYYGATIIHPKTIKPLQNANIPLLVKPFNDPSAPGTIISQNASMIFPKPVIIVKHNQTLLSVSAKDLSFITEHHLSDIFRTFARHHFKINTMQISALSFSACFDMHDERLEGLLTDLRQDFKVKYNIDAELFTVRHYQQAELPNLTLGKTVLLEQISRNTAQMVVRKHM